jgi:hypothetical protein
MTVNMEDYLQEQYENAVKQGTLPEGGLTDEHAKQVSPFDLLSSNNYTTREIRDERLDACKDCDRLFKPTRTCRECGCFMSMKTWLKDASCPIGKWGVSE